ncbi:O-antigen ligase family protein [Shumkonia mesophila]|uniref:O-antigen ligase family protein n=1 Tax=Shumkonia mesophila TaxID=2838854 RepID=UPI002934322B|nr:O-antigen ligase family protein [Shumkonia mesophila]
MRSVNAPEEPQALMAVSVRIAAVAMGLSSLALLNSRGAFAAILVAGMLAMLFSPGRAETFHNFRRAAVTPQVTIAVAVLTAWVPSTVLSYLPWASVQVLARMALFLALGVWVYAYFSGRPRALDLLLKVLFVGLAFGLLVADFGVWAFPDVMVLVKGRVASSTEHAVLMVKGFASAAVVLVPFVAWAGWRLGGLWKAASLALAMGLLTLAVLAGSRAGMAGLIGALGIVLVACVTRGESRRWAASLVLVFVLTIAGILFYLSARPHGGPVPEDALIFPAWLVDSHRQVIWQYALHLVEQRPWVGWGINTINLVPQLPGTSSIEFGVPVLPSHPHNWVLEVFAETGIIGGLAMLIAVALQFFTMLRRYRMGGEGRILAALAASAAFFVSGLFNFSFWSAWWQVSYVLVLALLYAGRPAEAGRETPRQRSGSISTPTPP